MGNGIGVLLLLLPKISEGNCDLPSLFFTIFAVRLIVPFATIIPGAAFVTPLQLIYLTTVNFRTFADERHLDFRPIIP